MINIVNKLFKSLGSNSLKKYSATIEKINKFEKEISNLSDLQLKEKTPYFKEQILNGSSLEKILPEAFAVVREVAKRTVKMRHFDVQLIGGIVLHEGKITEMKTGEGKTLVATLAAYLNTLDGKCVHIVTVNDYLAKRDSEWMGQVYNFLGLSVGCINSGMDDVARKKQRLKNALREHKPLDKKRMARDSKKRRELIKDDRFKTRMSFQSAKDETRAKRKTARDYRTGKMLPMKKAIEILSSDELHLGNAKVE